MDLMGSKQDDAVAVELTWDELTDFKLMLQMWTDTACEMFRDPSPHMTKEDRESNKRYWEHLKDQRDKVEAFIATQEKGI
jgi:hypothetical protein